MDHPLTASVNRWCEITDMGKTLTYELISQGKIVSFKLGKKRLIKVAESLSNIQKAA